VVRSYGLYTPTKTARLDLARTSQHQPPFERPAFLPWQAYYRRLTGRHDATTCPFCGCPLIARTTFPRRAKDPPRALSSLPTAIAPVALPTPVLRPIGPFPPPRARPYPLSPLLAPMDYTYFEHGIARRAPLRSDRGRPTAFKVHSSGKGRASPTRR
jgi:hypothetical protein